MDSPETKTEPSPADSVALTERHSRKNIIFGTLLGYIGLVLAVVVKLVYTPLIINSIGKGPYGIYTLASSLIDLFVLDFGLSATVNTFLSRYRAEGKQEEIKKFLSTMYRLYFLLDLVIFIVFLVIYFLIDPLYHGLSVDEKSQFKVVWIISGVFSLISFPCSIFGGTLSAYEEYVWIKAIDIINKILFIGLMAVSLALGWGLYALVIIQSGSNLLCIGIKYLIMHFKLGIHADFHYRSPWNEMKGIITYSLWAAIVSLCSRLIFSVTPSILGIVSDSTNITIFSAAAALEACTYLFSSVMSGFFLPKITRIFADKSLDSGKELTTLGITVGKIQYFIMALIFVGFACCGKEFVTLWLGDPDTYAPVYWGTLAMIAYNLFSVPQIVFNTAMYANNNLKHLTLSMLITSAINVGLSFLLSYYYGALGACLAIGVSRFVQLAIDNYFYRRDLQIDLWSFAKKVFGLPTLPGLLVLGMGLLMLSYLPTSPKITFAIQISSMIVVYCLVGWFVSFSKKERADVKTQAKALLTRSANKEEGRP
jgi:O-antigen/teichoic acid export membrane protein